MEFLVIGIVVIWLAIATLDDPKPKDPFMESAIESSDEITEFYKHKGSDVYQDQKKRRKRK